MIKFVSDLSVVSLGTPVTSTNTTDFNDLTEILLKVELNTIINLHIAIYLFPKTHNCSKLL